MLRSQTADGEAREYPPLTPLLALHIVTNARGSRVRTGQEGIRCESEPPRSGI